MNPTSAPVPENGSKPGGSRDAGSLCVLTPVGVSDIATEQSQTNLIAAAERARIQKELSPPAISDSLIAGMVHDQLGISQALNSFITLNPDTPSETIRTVAKLSALLKHAREPLLLVTLIQDFFPQEVANLLGAGNASPEGTASPELKYSTRLCGLVKESRTSGEVLQYPELDRALVGLVCTIQLLTGDWDLLRECQKNLPPFLQLSDQSCAEMQRLILKVIDGDIDAFKGILAVGLILDLDLKYVLSNDAGKMKSVADRLQEKRKSGLINEPVDTVDHDRVLYLALKHCPELFPGFQGLPQSLQDRWIQALGVKLNPLQLNQLENLPVSIQPEIFDLPIQSLGLRCVESLGDLFGAQGHVKQNGSSAMIEPVCKGMLLTFNALLESHASGLNPSIPHDEAIRTKQKEVYDRVVAEKNRLGDWGFNITNETDWVLARLCASARIENRAGADAVRAAFAALPEGTGEYLVQEMGKTGLTELGVWIEYLPACLVNSIGYYEKKLKQPKVTAIQNGFGDMLPAFVRIFNESSAHRTADESKTPGEFVINAQALAKIAIDAPHTALNYNFAFEPKDDGMNLSLITPKQPSHA